jgi:hypothetical protein
MFNRRMLIPVLNELKAGNAEGCLENHHLLSRFGQIKAPTI